MGKKSPSLRAAELAEHFVKRHMERVVKNAIIPNKRDLPLGRKHAKKFSPSSVDFEPMKCLSRRDQMNRCRIKRHGLGTAFDAAIAVEFAEERICHPAHFQVWLNRNHPVSVFQ
jgi:hypothetical protein